MEPQTQQQPTPQPEKSKKKKKFYKKWWFWIPITLVVIVFGGWYVMYFFLNEPGCDLRDSLSSKTMIYVQPAGCVEAGETWGQQCISNEDCYGDYSSECNPSGKYSGGDLIGNDPFLVVIEPEINNGGFILGTCGAAGYNMPEPILRDELDGLDRSPFELLFLM